MIVVHHIFIWPFVLGAFLWAVVLFPFVRHIILDDWAESKAASTFCSLAIGGLLSFLLYLLFGGFQGGYDSIWSHTTWTQTSYITKSQLNDYLGKSIGVTQQSDGTWLKGDTKWAHSACTPSYQIVDKNHVRVTSFVCEHPQKITNLLEKK